MACTFGKHLVMVPEVQIYNKKNLPAITLNSYNRKAITEVMLR